MNLSCFYDTGLRGLFGLGNAILGKFCKTLDLIEMKQKWNLKQGPYAIKIIELLCNLRFILLRYQSDLEIILLCKLRFIRNLCTALFLFYSHFQSKNLIAMEF